MVKNMAEINSQTISVGNPTLNREFFIKNNSNIGKQATAILGNAVLGQPFVPDFSSNFNSTVNLQNEYFNAFSTKNGSYIENALQFDRNIIPYLSAYSVLSNGGQLNFTRLAGLDLAQKDPGNPNYAGLKPGFLIDPTQKIYACYLELQRAPARVNQFNYNLLSTNNVERVLVGYILTAKNVTLSVSLGETINDEKIFKLIITGATNLSTETNTFSQFTVQENIKSAAYDNVIFSFNKRNHDNFFWKNVLNLNELRLDEFGYTFIYYKDVMNDILDSYTINDCKLVNISNVPNIKNFQQEFKYANTPWIVSQGFYSLNELSDRRDLRHRVKKLFRIHAINPGKYSNQLGIKITPRTLNNHLEYASFDLHLINTRTDTTIFEFNNLDLNQDSVNFIGRVIGTQFTYFDLATRRIVTQGEYLQQNPWIRVELSNEVLSGNLKLNTIPAGFLGYNRLNDITDGSNTVKSNYLNYVACTQMDLDSDTLFEKHTWGKNFKNIEVIRINRDNRKKKFNAAFKKKIDNQNFSETIVQSIDYYNRIHYSYYNQDLVQDRATYNEEYLNQYFFESNSSNILTHQYDDMFHLEKIYLLNEKKENNYLQRWDLAKYQHDGNSIKNLIFPASIVKNSLFPIQASVDTIKEIFYYFTINQKSITKSFDENYNSEYARVDSIEEVNFFDDQTSVLSFSLNLTGGFDGLNMFDENEFAITDIGLNNSKYLRELYKIGLDIINQETNGQNEIIYLPEIYQPEIVEYATQLISQNGYSMLLLDKPLMNNADEIIYCKNLLSLPDSSPESDFSGYLKWAFKKYVYKYSTANINVEEQDKINIVNTLQSAKYNQTLSQVSSYMNYCLCEINNTVDTTLINDGITRNIVLPAGVMAVSILSNYSNNINNMRNPISNVFVTNIGSIMLKNVYCNLINYDNPAMQSNIQLINLLQNNFFYIDLKNRLNTYTFFSNKTHAFTSNNPPVLSRLNIRNILCNLKRTIKLASLLLLFEQIKSQKEVLKRLNLLYTSILISFQNRGEIAEFKIKLDEESTTTEDLLNNLLRGAIFVKFRGQSNIEIVKFEI